MRGVLDGYHQNRGAGVSSPRAACSLREFSMQPGPVYREAGDGHSSCGSQHRPVWLMHMCRGWWGCHVNIAVAAAYMDQPGKCSSGGMLGLPFLQKHQQKAMQGGQTSKYCMAGSRGMLVWAVPPAKASYLPTQHIHRLHSHR